MGSDVVLKARATLSFRLAHRSDIQGDIWRCIESTPYNLQMSDIEMPVCPVCNVNIAIRPVGVGNVVNLHAGRKHVDNDSIIERHDARTELFAPDKLGVR